MGEDRVSRNAGWAFATQIIGACFTAGLLVFLGRTLTPDAYGHFAFAISVALLASLVADLGLSASSARFVAERVDDPPAAAAVFRTALRLKLLLAAVVATLLFALADPICALFGSEGAEWALRGAAIALVGQSIVLLVLATFAALRKQRFGTVLTFSESAIEVAASVGLVLAGAGAAGAAFGRAIGYAAGLLVALALAAYVVGRPGRPVGELGRGERRRRRRPVSAQRILRYAGPLLAVDAAFRVFGTIDVLLISALLGGGAAVAAFELPMRLIVFADYPAAAVASAVAPRFARRKGHPPDVGLLETVLRYLVLVQVAIAVPLAVWPEAIVELVIGDRYPDAPEVIRALVPFVVLAGLAAPVTLAVNYLGEARRRVPLAVAMLAVNALVDVLLLREIGVVAAAIGTSAAYAIWVPGHLWLLRRHAGLAIAPLVATTARALTAGGAAALALTLLADGDPTGWELALGALVMPAVYLVTLVGVGEVDRRDVVAVRRVIARTPPAASLSSSSA